MATAVLSVPFLGTLATHHHHSSIVGGLMGSLGVCANVNAMAWLALRAAVVVVANVTAIL
jgi:hypothetical protein